MVMADAFPIELFEQGKCPSYGGVLRVTYGSWLPFCNEWRCTNHSLVHMAIAVLVL